MASVREITFLDSERPVVAGGEHELTVRQVISVQENGRWVDQETLVRRQAFIVDAPRFSIDPDCIHSTHPPVGGVGRFHDTLPHVVLSDATLPWQRTFFRRQDAEGKPRGWLALLLFDADEAPRIRRFDIKEREATSLQSTQATEIVVNAALLDALLGTPAELDALTHSRHVNADRKPSVEGDDADDRFSVIVGNRLPAKEGEQVAHLVSLETVDESHLIDGVRHVILTSLYHWHFESSSNTTGSLISTLQSLDPGPFALPVKVPRDRDSAETKYVKRAFAQGYCALNHAMRGPSTSVSWYRGPLQPVAKQATLFSLDDLPSMHADRLLRYDADIGMFDVSFAAAWQLGRLRALSDPTFSATLLRWRESRILQRFVSAQTAAEKRRAESSRSSATPPAATTASKGTASASRLRDRPEHVTAEALLSSFQSLHAGLQRRLTSDGNGDLDDDIENRKSLITWLSELANLKRLPLHYLIPHANMLPMESLRFFSLDRNWVMSLLAGALSLGGDTKDETATLYSRLLNVLKRRKDNAIGIFSDGEPISGFLLRSSALETWQGIEVLVDTDAPGGEKAEPLQLDRLTPTLLFGLYRGTIRSLEFVEPSESLTFAQAANRPFPLRNERLRVVDVSALDRFSEGSATLAKAIAQKGQSVRFDFKPQTPTVTPQ